MPTFIPNQATVTAGGNGFLLTNWEGYSTDYHGLEIGITKRLSDRWMGRVGFAFNNAREHYAPQALQRHNGNPTPTLTEPLEGRRPVRAAERRQRRRHDLHQRQMAVQRQRDVSGAVRHRGQRERVRAPGLSVPDLSPAVARRRRGGAGLLTPEIDTFRFDNLWNTDLRVARSSAPATRLRLIGDLFNVLNANTALVRDNNVGSPTFSTLAQNLSPRIFRVGLIVGF